MLLIFSPDQPFLLPKKMLYFTTVATDAISDLISFLYNMLFVCICRQILPQICTAGLMLFGNSFGQLNLKRERWVKSRINYKIFPVFHRLMIIVTWIFFYSFPYFLPLLLILKEFYIFFFFILDILKIQRFFLHHLRIFCSSLYHLEMFRKFIYGKKDQQKYYENLRTTKPEYLQDFDLNNYCHIFINIIKL